MALDGTENRLDTEVTEESVVYSKLCCLEFGYTDNSTSATTRLSICTTLEHMTGKMLLFLSMEYGFC
jgi:hypothetical protein